MEGTSATRTRSLDALPGLAGVLAVLALVAGSPSSADPGATSGGVAASVPATPCQPAQAGAASTPVPDTVVVVVSSESPLEELTGLRLSDLYLGRTSRFPDGRPAEPIDQEPGTRTRQAFYETYLGRSPSEIKAHWSKAVFTGRGRPPPDVEDGGAMKEALAGNPRAIGYIDRSLVDGSVRVVRVTGTE